ncbi:hypothetical protein DM860_014776 [Cuscuta australis]|uniref:DUF632 domain-containing protein n=1 Tax=Cuscuta australis TaxID=267555 RepID=A0A328D1R4_9ASTE|nr:hypothetical protein DM860_014776 [Cuscuta australis]
MGTANSRIEEDKALQICRDRKKIVRQALDGRCSLAATHVAYIEALKMAGRALRNFVESEAPIDSSIYTQSERSLSQFSFSSVPKSQHVDVFLSPSPPTSSRYNANHMKFRGTFSKEVEEKPNVSVTVSVTSFTPHNSLLLDTPPTSYETPSAANETPPWDFFGLVHTSHGTLGGQSKAEDDRGSLSEDGQYSNGSSPERESSHESNDGFDDPSTETLVQRFVNVNRSKEDASADESVMLEAKAMVGEKGDSPADLSPLRPEFSGVATAVKDDEKTPLKETNVEHKVAPKDLLSSMRDIELLFIKASESGREVPLMLEANKFNFRPIGPSSGRGSIAKTLLRSCFSCEQEEAAQISPKYMRWHRTTSISSSSRNLLGVNSTDQTDEYTNNLFTNSCMNSGSLASTLDRLHAWEKKLYDEVKACEILRCEYDAKRKLLRQIESLGKSQQKIDKKRAAVKDLHSRIGVAIHRINSISRKIEELRDDELQPQLEELIEGLRKIWEGMLNCHAIQLHIISIAHLPGNIKLSINSESHRQITIHLENEMISLSSTFTKWVAAQMAYVKAINTWLTKCVSLKERSSKRKKIPQESKLRELGPPIYTICGAWLDMLRVLPAKDVADAVKDLAAEATHFLPRQEKSKGGKGDEAVDDLVVDYDQFRTSMALFLSKLNNFAESSVMMYTKLQCSVQESKKKYAQVKPADQEHSFLLHI